MNLNKLVIAALLSCATISAHVSANDSDLTQDVKVAANNFDADIKNNRVIYSGAVKVTQGSIKINAAKLIAFTDPKDNSRTLIAQGDLATFSQIMQDGRPATASAKEIRYDINQRTLTLEGNATLEQDGNKVSGTKMTYNLDKQKLTAESAGDGRVISIFKPESYQAEEQKQEQP